ncbi:MAG TPA: aminotransferase class I/II-fold pyridoxal phosphate-dependent enzyme [Thermoanaerobaculia bacterium]|jgi:DNA-binding transcriptional MocR family regulator|nr:aminotransferase class I/II-fold pyridoxal phosphate-dependent enzyme [Thermoanaerobaculia bacterium]
MSVQRYLSGTTAVKIAASAEAAVAGGKLAGGDRLPTVRVLAQHLGVSPVTVAAAYRILQQRGIAFAEGRRGTTIRHASSAAPAAPAQLPPHVRDLATGNPASELLPDLAPFLRKLDGGPRLYRDDLNDPELVALAQKQFSADGIPAGSVAVVSGALDGIERVLREQLRPGDRVLVEDPCFTGIADLLRALSMVPVPVALDEEGLLPAAIQRAGAAEAIIVTPRAQNPTGAAVTEQRGRQLRAILRQRPELLVIEDDHAGPVAGAPYVTLVDTSRARWAVVRSMSKSLGPDLRLAILTGDARTIARVDGRQALGTRWVSHILQKLVVALWDDKGVQKLLVRAGRTYSQRRDALLKALYAQGIEAQGISGLNVWIPLPEESAAVQALFQRGWAVAAGERYRIRTPPAIRVTIASLDVTDARAFADDLAEVLRPAQRRAAGA